MNNNRMEDAEVRLADLLRTAEPQGEVLDAASAQRVREHAMKAFQEAESAQHQKWRQIMKAAKWPMSAAAAVAVAVGLFAVLASRSASPAYAISQTIQASGDLRSVHLRYRSGWDPDPVTGEAWLECDEKGAVTRLRSETTRNGVFEILVLDHGMARALVPSQNRLTVAVKDINRVRAEWTTMLERVDARALLQQASDQVQVALPKTAGQPIVVRTTSAIAHRMFQIDPQTKLIKHVESYERKKIGEYALLWAYDYLAYNQPIDPAKFVLDVPSGVTVVDEMQGVGLPQGQMSEPETATEVVRQYLEAIAAKGYEKAAILSDSSAEGMREFWGKYANVRVLRVGPATLSEEWQECGVRAYEVLYEYELQRSDGTVEVVGPPSPTALTGGGGPIEHRTAGVCQVPGHPDRWMLAGGI